MQKKEFWIKVWTLSGLLSAVLIVHGAAAVIGIAEEAINAPSFIFSFLYTAAWAGVVILAHIKRLRTVQVFSAVYLGLTSLLFFVTLLRCIFVSLSLPIGISAFVWLETVPFWGWYHAVGEGVGVSAFGLALTGLLAAAAVVSLNKNFKRKKSD